MKIKEIENKIQKRISIKQKMIHENVNKISKLLARQIMRKRKKTQVTKIMTGTGGITIEFTKAKKKKKVRKYQRHFLASKIK